MFRTFLLLSNSALKVLVEIRQGLGEDAKLRFNMTKVEIYIPGVRRERARKIVLRNIEQDLPTEHGCLSGSNMVRIFSTSLQVMPQLFRIIMGPVPQVRDAAIVSRTLWDASTEAPTTLRPCT